LTAVNNFYEKPIYKTENNSARSPCQAQFGCGWPRSASAPACHPWSWVRLSSFLHARGSMVFEESKEQRGYGKKDKWSSDQGR
jgi:hypothetical protein